MKKILSSFLYLTASLFIFSTFQSCQNDFEDSQPDLSTSLTSSTLRTFDPSELNQMEEILSAEGITISNDTSDLQTRGIFVDDIFIDAIKVSCKSPSPKNDGSLVDMSGVLLVPRKSFISNFTSFRLMVVTPPTYTSNESAPSNLFKRTSLISKDGALNMFYFFTLQAKSGYAVLIPDYLGFGDSYKQCTHPYLESKPMVESVINLTKAAQSTLTNKGYKYKKELVVTGYSQGGFMAASLTRELETDYSNTYPVNLLVTGGTPCNLKQIVDVVRQSETLTHTYFVPYALWGFKQNGYPQIDVNSILQEPYASQLSELFDGTHGNLNDSFPTKVTDLYTEKFINDLDTDPSLAYVNQILDENSVKPWINKCKFVMTHATKDVSVYYEQAKDFADQQNALGGKVVFYPTVGDHIVGAIPYYAIAQSYFPFYK